MCDSHAQLLNLTLNIDCREAVSCPCTNTEQKLLSAKRFRPEGLDFTALP